MKDFLGITSGRFRNLWIARFLPTLLNRAVILFSFASLTAYPQTPPLITSQPHQRTVVDLGGATSISVVAEGATAFQWRRGGKVIVGASGATLNINNAKSGMDDGWYQVVASNIYGAVTSRLAFVNIALPVRVVGWGSNREKQISIPSGINRIVDIAAGGYYGMALLSDGTVSVWGANDSGAPISYKPSGLSSVVAISAGYNHCLALRSDGTVVAWGTNSGGEVSIPAGLDSVVAVAGGERHSLALRSDGTVVAWGDNNYEKAVVPSYISGISEIGAGPDHSIAMKADGTIFVWGSNRDNQASVPTGLTGVVGISTGYTHALALKADGTVAGWGGYNNFGSYGYNLGVPTGLSGVVRISAGGYHSFAIKADGSLVAWGKNDLGQTLIPSGLRGVQRVRGGVGFSLAAYLNAGDLPPVIEADPQPIKGYRDSSVSLSVSFNAGTSPDVSFQWRKNGFSISGATNSLFQIPKLTVDSAGEYDVVVSNYLGFAVSASANVSIKDATSPEVLTAPTNVTIPNGERTQLKVTATGAGPLTYQWYQGQSGTTTTPILGATNPTVTTPSLSATSSYWVRITDGNGSVTNSPTVTVTVSATSPLSVAQQVVGPGYNVGGVVAVTNTITYSGTAPSRIDWSTLLPAGWKYLGSGGSEGGARPPYESGDLLEWSWTTVPASPIKFTYTVGVPAGTTGDQVIASLVSSQAAGTNYQTMAKPDPLVIRSASLHTADSNRDGRISLTELTRVIELYNYRSGTTRTGQYKPASGTEDGFAPGP